MKSLSNQMMAAWREAVMFDAQTFPLPLILDAITVKALTLSHSI